MAFAEPVLYLDHAATTPVRPETRAAMEPFLGEAYGNPSGTHSVSRSAKGALEEAREEAARILGARHPLDIVFTGSGTESDNLAIAGRAMATAGGVITTAIEHEAVLETVRFLGRLGHSCKIMDLGPGGVVDADELAAAVDFATTVVSVMSANNETGVVQPVTRVAAAVRDRSDRVLIHSDAVQSFVSEETTLESLDVDMLSLSAHKFGGPQGVGLLHVRREVELEPVLHGGGQELGRRSGTHNVAGVVGMVAAMRAAVSDRERFRTDVTAARDAFEDALLGLVPDTVFTTPRQGRLVQHSHFRIPGVDSETLLVRLDAAGVAAAAGAACSSGAIDVSHVLRAMGLAEDEARSSIRVTFGWTTRPEHGPEAAQRVARCVEELR